MHTVRKNLILNILYQILIIIIPLITTPYVSRVLGSDGVGRYSYTFAIAYYFAIFAMLGVNNYGNRTIATVSGDKEKQSKTFWSIYLFQLFFAVISVVAYILYIIFLCDDKLLGWIMLAYVLSAAFDINWFFFGMEEFKITVA
ncbi:TPA: oligosaccharide flippase family protein, partial [Enterococcus faecium]